MPSFCVVVQCSSRGERDQVRFFRIPAAFKDRGEKLNALSSERRECWVNSLKRGKLSETFLKNARICSKHFISGAPAELKDKNNPDWIPSQNRGYTSIREKGKQAVERHVRVGKRSKRLEADNLDNYVKAGHSRDLDIEKASTELELVKEGCANVEVQTDMNMDDITRLLNDTSFTTEKIQYLQSRLNILDFSEESFLDNDEKTLYFTGFPKTKMMMIVYKNVSAFLSLKSVLSPFKQFLLTLMKLRVNLPFKYLSYKFGIAPSTVSDIFFKCVDVMYSRYKGLVVWPDRESLQKNVPDCFKENFGNRVTVIIDCFEIFCETPSDLANAARCWSNYKHHETIKVLIGITPQGTISYISEAWAGRTSDKYLTENCGFLNKLLPGDVILADRGFLIEDSVKTLGGHLEIPAFTKGKKQLHPLDFESTRKIANVRIHIERVIGLLRRKYKICVGPLPLSMISVTKDNLSAIDKILVICSAFFNLCPSQIPMN